jgi:putative endonuclease
MKMKTYFVYILFGKRDGVLYVGVTNDIFARIADHKAKINKRSFTAKYNINKIGYLEGFNDINDAIAREKQLKAGSRADKINLIEGMNPDWCDLTDELMNLMLGLKMSWQ